MLIYEKLWFTALIVMGILNVLLTEPSARVTPRLAWRIGSKTTSYESSR